MVEWRRLNPDDLAALLAGIQARGCPASLRVEGTARILGQLRVRALEPGCAIQLEGAKRRDFMHPAGTAVALTVLMDDQVVVARSLLLQPLPGRVAGLDHPPVLRLAWPEEPLEFHHREEVRVATPDLEPLEATLLTRGLRFPAKLLNLTETGMGLGLEEPLPFELAPEVEVETRLPGGFLLRMVGQVRHREVLEDDPLPVRIGLVLRGMPPQLRETLRGMIQVRRILRSEALRER